MTEYIKGARYRITLDAEWTGEGFRTDTGETRPRVARGASVEKIADPTPEWLPGDKVLRGPRNDSVAIHREDGRWDVYYDNAKSGVYPNAIVLFGNHWTPIVKQGERVVQ